MSNKTNRMSEDIVALRKLVEFNIPAKSARWEVFGSPEQDGFQFVPGPTDYLVLIAELTSVDFQEITALPTGQETQIIPESARPWLDEKFRVLFERGKSSRIDLSANSNCRPLTAELRKQNKPVKGFICGYDKKALIYLILSDFSRT